MIEYNKILLRYGELTLKGDNKKDFIRALKQNLLAYFSKEEIKVEYDRAFINYSKENLEKINYIFGLSSYSNVIETSTSLEDIQKVISKLLDKKAFNSFAINSRRHNKNYPMTSLELNIHFGNFVSELFPKATVKLENPDICINIEIKDKFAYIFIDKIEALGGMPLAPAGSCLHLISGGFDSPVAAYLLQKKGLKVSFLNFITPPHTDFKTINKIKDIVSHLTKYQCTSTLYQINFTKIMNLLSLTSEPKYRITLMRRSFFRIANAIAKKNKMLALSTGESLAQVASQTVESMSTISKVTDLLIYRPLLTYDKNEIINIAKQIKTHDISIQKACESCELFAPKNPTTKPNLLKVIELEKELGALEEFEKEAIEKVEIIKFKI